MLGFTGTYEGRPISVMGSGTGYALHRHLFLRAVGVLRCDNIIRIGSAGSYTADAKLFDTVLATGAVSESNYARVQSGNDHDITFPSETLNDKLRLYLRQEAGHQAHRGQHPPSDVFYRQPSDAKPTYWELLRDERLGVEMEALLSPTPRLWARTLPPADRQLCLPGRSPTAEQRQKSFTDMMKVALGAEY